MVQGGTPLHAPKHGGEAVLQTPRAGKSVEMVCPACRGDLETDGSGLKCCACGQAYPSDPATGVRDLRLRTPKRVSLELVVPPVGASGPPELVDALVSCPVPQVDWSGYAPPVHLDPRLMSYLPRPSTPGALALDLGCGDGSYRGAMEHAGYRWVGLDIDPASASVVGDAQALPFANGSFDTVLSLTVLEHIQHPLLFASEAYRVLAPGRTLLGSAAFLEPMHSGSFYHHTHRGLWNTLTSAGFNVTMIAASPRWTVLRAQSGMALFPRMPLSLATAMVMPLQGAHRLWWLLAELAGMESARAKRLSMTAGSFHFVAEKPHL